MVANILRGVGYELFTSESTASVFFNNNLKAISARSCIMRPQLLKQGGFKKQGDILYDGQWQ